MNQTDSSATGNRCPIIPEREDRQVCLIPCCCRIRMRKAARKLLWAAAGLLALALLIAPLVLNSRGPSYRGRTLTAWTTEFDGIGGPKRDEAEVAVRSIGTNGLSCIRSMLRAKDTPLKVQANALLSRQSWIKFRFVSAQVLRQRGLRACRALGTNARPAIPDITALVYDPQLSRDAATVLTQFGSEVIPILTNAAAHPDPRIRYGAIAPIAILDDQSTVPTLLRCPSRTRTTTSEHLQPRPWGSSQRTPRRPFPPCSKASKIRTLLSAAPPHTGSTFGPDTPRRKRPCRC